MAGTNINLVIETFDVAVRQWFGCDHQESPSQSIGLTHFSYQNYISYMKGTCACNRVVEEVIYITLG